MEIVIKIPKEFENHFNSDKFEDSLQRIRFDIHKAIIARKDILSGNYEIETLDMLTEAFLKGTPLPKGHGRLGDLDALETEMVNGIHAGNYEEGYEEYGHINNMDDCVECVKYADTIIEADKESEDE